MRGLWPKNRSNTLTDTNYRPCGSWCCHRKEGWRWGRWSATMWWSFCRQEGGWEPYWASRSLQHLWQCKHSSPLFGKMLSACTARTSMWTAQALPQSKAPLPTSVATSHPKHIPLLTTSCETHSFSSLLSPPTSGLGSGYSYWPQHLVHTGCNLVLVEAKPQIAKAAANLIYSYSGQARPGQARPGG